MVFQRNTNFSPATVLRHKFKSASRSHLFKELVSTLRSFQVNFFKNPLISLDVAENLAEVVTSSKKLGGGGLRSNGIFVAFGGLIVPRLNNFNTAVLVCFHPLFRFCLLVLERAA